MHELTPATRLLATIHNGSFGLAEQLDRWMRSVPFAPLLHLRRTLYRKALLSRTPFRGDGLLDLFELFLAGSGEPR